MCGITGFWEAQANSGKQLARSVIQTMTNALAHRGPDACGEYVDTRAGIALGHRRLSIVDLSDAGHQPMRSACDRYWMVYNGEIYNHMDIRAELAQAGQAVAWRGHSDTETLLAAISVWGFERALSRLTGMFAIALWDTHSRRLSLARDRFGEKPLYYGVVGNTLVFGSELRALRLHPNWQSDLDERAIGQFLRYSSVPAPRSVYTNIKKLPAAHWVELVDPTNLPEPSCFWNVDDLVNAQLHSDAEPDANDSLVDSLQALVRSAVGSRMMSDVPLGAFLSGGVDSSLVVSMMQESSTQPVNTFCIGFEESSHDESGYARAVAEHLGTHHTEHIVTSSEALEVIPSLCDIWDEPFADSSQIPTFLVSRLARESVTVSLSGDGGDELFAGYRRYAKTMGIREKLAPWPNLTKRLVASASTNMVPAFADALHGKDGALGSVANKLDYLVSMAELISSTSDERLYDSMLALRSGPHPLMKSVSLDEQRFLPDISSTVPFAQHMMQKDIKQYLSEVILTKVDRSSMSVSLETRAPLLDPDIAAFALALPWSVKQHEGQGKWPLVSLLKRYIPAQMVDRPKKGFGVPIQAWLRGPLLPWAEELLSPELVRKSGLLNEKAVSRLWSQHKSGRYDWHHPLWNVLMLQMWLQKHHF